MNSLVRRRAVLIGWPYGGDYLHGVKSDLVNVKKYLCSPHGGSWLESEIETLESPTLDQVQLALLRATADYSIVYFSGHGYTDNETGNRMISLRDYHISDRYLLNNSSRQLVIIDACRNILPAGISGIPVDKYNRMDNFSGLIASSTRQMFDRYVRNSSPGKLIIHSTSVGHSSYYNNDGSGGVFTNALLSSSVNIRPKDSNRVYFIQDIVSHVHKGLSGRVHPQFPSIAYSKGDLRVPFAFVSKLQAQETQRAVTKPVFSNSDNSGKWILAGLSLLIVAAAIAD